MKIENMYGLKVKEPENNIVTLDIKWYFHAGKIIIYKDKYGNPGSLLNFK